MISHGAVKYRIVIPLDRSRSNYREAKGKLFENLVGRFLQFQSYVVRDRIRDVGSEIDLKCVSKLSQDVAIVECKARSENVQADAVNKLHTDVSVEGANHGWIFSISDIGKEAEARIEKLNQRSERQAYRFFSPQELVQLVVDAGGLRHPTTLPESGRTELFLCLLEGREIWAAPVWSPTRVLRGLLAWGANDGSPIAPKDLPDFSSTDFPYPEAGWLDQKTADGQQSRDVQPVVEVIPGEEWSDYRPSRPTDFVGRQGLIQEVRHFFDRVRRGNTSSRLFGIKGQSGWGKSSLALKLAHELRRDRVFILPVDCRAAKASYYADLAICRALQFAEQELAPGPLFRSVPKIETNPFEDPNVQQLLGQAQTQGAVICVIFDQFEEIIHRSELAATFTRMRELALAADEARAPFTIGFSWKTDGTVASDYPGYHLWHSLSDRRKDFIIDRFAREDADDFLFLAQRESKQSLKRNITKFIIENYAGYPWLLKKLAKHYIEDAKAGRDAAVLGSLPSLESLFQNDMQELSGAQRRALKFIAQNSPVEYGSAADKYGAEDVASLVNQRLVINTGGKLNLYWDIFREYILYDEVPQLPKTYVPTVSVRRIRGILRTILDAERVHYHDFADQLSIQLATTDNAVRDLANMGIVRPNRLEQYFDRICETSGEATTKIVDFLRAHAIFIKAKELIDNQSRASFSEICAASEAEYAFLSIDESTLRQYCRRILVYCLHFGLLAKDGTSFRLGEPLRDIFEAHERIPSVSEVDIFRAAAPPARVIELLDLIRAKQCETRSHAARLGLRNAVFAANALGLIVDHDKEIGLSELALRVTDSSELVRSTLGQIEPFRSGLSEIDEPSLSADEVGAIIADMYGLNWSTGSCKRYGSALKRWIRFARAQ